jgi:protein TonB
VTAGAVAVVMHAALGAAMVTVNPARFHSETPIEIDVEERKPPPPDVKPERPEPPKPPPDPRRIAVRRTAAPVPPPTTPPPPSAEPPKTDAPPVFGVSMDSVANGPGEGMAVPVGNTLMAKPGKPAKPAEVKSAPEGHPFTPVADIYIAKYAEPLFIVNGDDIYPDEARRMGIEGVVRIKLGVDERGKVVQVKVVEGAGHGFDEAAAKAMWKARFKPATGNDGQPLPSSFTFTYRFELNR